VTASSGSGPGPSGTGSESDTSGLYGDRGRSGDPDEEQPRVVIRDKRRIDPETGLLKPTGHTADVPKPACVKFLQVGD